MNNPESSKVDGHPLLSKTKQSWLTCVLDHFDDFLLDHAANERKASAVAMSMVAHYPDRTRLVLEMTDLALEELNHFRRVVHLIEKRGLQLAADQKDPYVGALRRCHRRGKRDYFLDRLLSAAVIEARGTERFGCLATAISDPELARFYDTLARSEATHTQLFLDLATEYFTPDEVTDRWSFWLDQEAELFSQLPILPRLH